MAADNLWYSTEWKEQSFLSLPETLERFISEEEGFSLKNNLKYKSFGYVALLLNIIMKKNPGGKTERQF